MRTCSCLCLNIFPMIIFFLVQESPWIEVNPIDDTTVENFLNSSNNVLYILNFIFKINKQPRLAHSILSLMIQSVREVRIFEWIYRLYCVSGRIFMRFGCTLWRNYPVWARYNGWWCPFKAVVSAEDVSPVWVSHEINSIVYWIELFVDHGNSKCGHLVPSNGAFYLVSTIHRLLLSGLLAHTSLVVSRPFLAPNTHFYPYSRLVVFIEYLSPILQYNLILLVQDCISLVFFFYIYI